MSDPELHREANDARFGAGRPNDEHWPIDGPRCRTCKAVLAPDEDAVCYMCDNDEEAA